MCRRSTQRSSPLFSPAYFGLLYFRGDEIKKKSKGTYSILGWYLGGLKGQTGDVFTTYAHGETRFHSLLTVRLIHKRYITTLSSTQNSTCYWLTTRADEWN